jgi:hypothetical protein
MTPASHRPTHDELQARLAHLNMVQLNIGRMAGYCAGLKTFTLTITAALIAVAFDRDLPVLFWIGFAMATVFGLLDAYYLALEQAFRDLYAEIVARDWSLAFALAIRPRSIGALHVCRAVGSVSVWVFYGALLVSFAALLHVQPHVQPDQPAEQSGQPTRRNRPIALVAPADDAERPAADRVADAAQQDEHGPSVGPSATLPTPQRLDGSVDAFPPFIAAQRPDHEPDR